MWYPDHIGERFAQEALASKLVKLADVRRARPTPPRSTSTRTTRRPSTTGRRRHAPTGRSCSACRRWPPGLGAQRADRRLRRAASREADRLGSVDPNEPGRVDAARPLRQRARAARAQGRPGLPALRPDRPGATGRSSSGAASLGIPTIWHQGTTFPSRPSCAGATRCCSRTWRWHFPDLRMIVAHLGHPWEEDLSR